MLHGARLFQYGFLFSSRVDGEENLQYLVILNLFETTLP